MSAGDVVFAALHELPPDTRRSIAEALDDFDSPFLAGLARVITFGGEITGPSACDHLIAVAVRDGEALELADALGDEPPWDLVAQALRYAVETGIDEADLDPQRWLAEHPTYGPALAESRKQTGDEP